MNPRTTKVMNSHRQSHKRPSPGMTGHDWASATASFFLRNTPNTVNDRNSIRRREFSSRKVICGSNSNERRFSCSECASMPRAQAPLPFRSRHFPFAVSRSQTSVCRSTLVTLATASSIARGRCVSSISCSGSMHGSRARTWPELTVPQD